MSHSSRRPLPIRVLLGLASGLCFAGWGVVATLLAWVVLPIVALRMRNAGVEERMERAQAITARGNGWLMWAMNLTHLIDFDPTPLEVPDGPFVLVANHPTLIDVCALTTIQPKLCVIAKPKLTRSVFVGRALRSAGHIEAPGRGGSVFGGAAVVAGAVDRLGRGFPVLVFPEGTRSPAGSLGTFTRGAFEIAKRANVPIVCAFIRANPPTLCRGMRWYNLPKQRCDYSIECLPAVSLAQFDGDSKAAAEHFRSILAAQVACKPTESPTESTQQAGVTR